MKKIGKLFGGILVLGGAGALASNQVLRQGPPPLQVTVERCTKATIERVVEAEGKLDAETSVEVAADVSGEVVELAVQEGQRVVKGQVLLRVRRDTYQAAADRQREDVASRRAGVAQAEAQLHRQQLTSDQAARDFARQAALYEQKVISRSDFEAAQAASGAAQAQVLSSRTVVQAARGQLAQAQAQFQQADKELQKTDIVAPVGGVVGRLYVEAGERVVGTAQRAGSPLVRLLEPAQLAVRMNVGEDLIEEVGVGDSATVQLPGGGHPTRLRGVVTQVATQALEGPKVRTVEYEVRVRVLTASMNPRGLRPGLRATVAIVTAHKDNVLSVPLSAVTTRIRGEKPAVPAPEEGLFDDGPPEARLTVAEPNRGSRPRDILVFVVQGDKVVSTPVKVGINDMYRMEILSGLPAGAVVASGPYRTVNKWLSGGSSVEVKAAGEITSFPPSK